MDEKPQSGAPLLSLDEVQVAYGNTPIVRGLSFTLKRGTIACLLGKSGCGKTTALRAIAGFEPVIGGEIRLNGNLISAPGLQVAPEKRRIGMVFQDFALFPHLSVADNIGFGLNKLDATTRAQRVGDMLDAVGLKKRASNYPHELSGGQQQRVALARALAPSPDLILLDEPFSNLDVELRERLAQEVRDIIKQTDTTAILVTHDQNEAFAIADEIGVMRAGRIEQWDGPYNLYHRPATRFVADFVGLGAFVPGSVLPTQQVTIELGMLNGIVPDGCGKGCADCGKGCHVDVLLRPDDIIHDDASPLQAEVEKKAFRGAEILYTLKLDSGRKVLALVPSHHNHTIGERIGIRLDVDHIVAFSPEATVTVAAPV